MRTIKKYFSIITCVSLLCVACGRDSSDNSVDDAVRTDKDIEVTDFPDKYTAYVKNYVGRNAASFGYAEYICHGRYDLYNDVKIQIDFTDGNGTYIGFKDEELEEYEVVAQSIEPNTEIKFQFGKEQNGEESRYPVWQNIRCILLKVKKAGSEESPKELISQTIPTDEDVEYVQDYVGRNLAECHLWNSGARSLKLKVIAPDRYYVGPDEEIEKTFCVTKQSPAPNTQITYEFTEKDGLVWLTGQSPEEIELYVSPLY